MGLMGFERRLERLVEGVFARAFKTSLRPVELGRRLVREMDDQRTVNVRGATAVPNDFTITLSPDDHAQLTQIGTSLSRELADAAREHARQEGYVFMGPVTVLLELGPELGTGSFGLSARFKEGPGGAGGGTLVLPNGTRVPLTSEVSLIGRGSDVAVKLEDTSVSRRHAEIRSSPEGFMVVDLGSTNGTKVNGVGVTERVLKDGDTLAVGDSQLRFEAS
jgi:hypothetical protein